MANSQACWIAGSNSPALRGPGKGLELLTRGVDMQKGASKEPLTILVADDSPVSRKLVERSLPADKYTVLLATNGHEALELFAKRQPAIVITDWLMPDLSGIELCQRIRAESQGYTYLILLTGVSDKGKVVIGLQAGADDYLTKPFHPEELVARVGVGQRILNLNREIEAKNRLLEELALTDELTGLPNRRAVERWAVGQLSGASRHRFPFWVVMADIDNFKSLNDRYGHDAGDAVLKSFAEILQTNTRKCDMCGRLGGDEFLLILTHVEKEGIQLAIERDREQFEKRQFVFGGQNVAVTASFGFSGYRGRERTDFNRLVTQADVALYSSKRQGRNRVGFAETEIY
jgi:two-component system cell cycle response regulator